MNFDNPPLHGLPVDPWIMKHLLEAQLKSDIEIFQNPKEIRSEENNLFWLICIFIWDFCWSFWKIFIFTTIGTVTYYLEKSSDFLKFESVG